MKMAKGDWSGLEHFTVDENWGDPYKMDRDLLYLLEYLRILFRFPFVVHCGYDTEGHSENSQHYVGKAVDFHVRTMNFKNAVDLLIDTLKTLKVGKVRMLFPKFMVGKYKDVLVADLIGLGIYPHWNSPGIHLDTRGHRARWGALNINGKQVYKSFKEVYGKI